VADISDLPLLLAVTRAALRLLNEAGSPLMLGDYRVGSPA
jgi:hypothetical protein